jgi:hypothetical protein
VFQRYIDQEEGDDDDYDKTNTTTLNVRQNVPSKRRCHNPQNHNLNNHRLENLTLNIKQMNMNMETHPYALKLGLLI